MHQSSSEAWDQTLKAVNSKYDPLVWVKTRLKWNRTRMDHLLGAKMVTTFYWDTLLFINLSNYPSLLYSQTTMGLLLHWQIIKEKGRIIFAFQNNALKIPKFKYLPNYEVAHHTLWSRWTEMSHEHSQQSTFSSQNSFLVLSSPSVWSNRKVIPPKESYPLGLAERN